MPDAESTEPAVEAASTGGHEAEIHGEPKEGVTGPEAQVVQRESATVLEGKLEPSPVELERDSSATPSGVSGVTAHTKTTPASGSLAGSTRKPLNPRDTGTWKQMLSKFEAQLETLP